jgi:hypothetical protein
VAKKDKKKFIPPWLDKEEDDGKKKPEKGKKKNKGK